MLSQNDIKFYNVNGYLIKKILNNEECENINKYIDSNDKNAYYEADTNNKFGYKFGKDEDAPVQISIKKNSFINQFASKILGEFDFSFIKSFYKSAFMARDIEYHQEYQYGAHHPSRGIWEDYMQIFLALEDHSLENACLKIIPKSHTLGLLPYKDIVNSNQEHKRAVEYNALKKAYDKFGILNCQLKKGEAIFFNHLIIHGSQNNNSTYTRRALVSTLYKKGLKLDVERYKHFEIERKRFTIKKLQESIDKLTNDITTLTQKN